MAISPASESQALNRVNAVACELRDQTCKLVSLIEPCGSVHGITPEQQLSQSIYHSICFCPLPGTRIESVRVGPASSVIGPNPHLPIELQQSNVCD